MSKQPEQIRPLPPAPCSATERWHAHLDDCEQCRDNPFALCSIGHRLLYAAAGMPYPESPNDQAEP